MLNSFPKIAKLISKLEEFPQTPPFLKHSFHAQYEHPR